MQAAIGRTLLEVVLQFSRLRQIRIEFENTLDRGSRFRKFAVGAEGHAEIHSNSTSSRLAGEDRLPQANRLRQVAGPGLKNTKIGRRNIGERIALKSFCKEIASLLGLSVSLVKVAESRQEIRIAGMFGEGLGQEFLGLGDSTLHAAFGERLPCEGEIARISGRSRRKAFQVRLNRSGRSFGSLARASENAMVCGLRVRDIGARNSRHVARNAVGIIPVMLRGETNGVTCDAFAPVERDFFGGSRR